MSSGYSPFPTQVMPELPTTGKSAPLPALQIAPLHIAPETVSDVPTTPRPAMPSLPSIQSVPLATAPPASLPTAALPQIPQTAEPTRIAAPASPFSTLPLAPVAAAPTTVAAPAAPSPAPAPVNPPFVVTPVSRVRAQQPTETLPTLPPLEREEARIDYTDSELLDVFRPLVEEAVHRSLFQPGGGMDTYLEPMLRATIRRALAEHSPTQAPFQEPGFFDRVAWRLRALFTSRTYEDIFFEKTKRFRVEEVYLLEKINLSMISYASSDPARYASAKRVHSTARRLADGALDKEGTIRLFFDLPEGRHAVVREGKDALLIAVILGTPNDGLRIDLDYTLRRIEERFGARFKNVEDPLLLSIQPHLEDCLLIIAPSSTI